MKYFILIVGVFLLLFVVMSFRDTPQNKEQVSPLNPVPDFSFETIEGKSISIADLKGKTILINFWATWCTPCIRELPDMLALAHKYEGKLVLLALSSDENMKEIQSFIQKQSPSLQKIVRSESAYIALDENRVLTRDLFQTYRYPETIIVDPRGDMVRKIIGEFDWTDPEIERYLNALDSL